MPTAVYFIIIALLIVLYAHEAVKRRRINKLYEQLHHQLATKDPLTGLYHRRFFDEYYLAETARVLSFVQNLPDQEEKHFFAISLFDIENFSDINIAYERNVGDNVLKQVATILTKLVFDRDLLCRYDGAEFAVLFTNSNNQQLVEQKSNLIKEQLEALQITANDGEIIRLKVSVGTAFFATDYMIGDQFSVIRAAEKRLRQLKRLTNKENQ